MTSIGTNAFFCCDNISSIIIPSNVKNIGPDAFYSCDKLSKVLISSDTTNIEKHAFSWCSNDLVIYGKPGSYAEEYSKNNGITFKDALEYIDDKQEMPDTPSDTPNDSANPPEIGGFSLSETATNILTGSEVRFSGRMGLTLATDDTDLLANVFDTEIHNITWKSSDEAVISAADIKCTYEPHFYSASSDLNVVLPVRKCGEVTITGTTRNGISASTKVEVFPKMTLKGNSVDAGENIYRSVCTVTLDNPDKSFLEQFMPKLKVVLDEDDSDKGDYNPSNTLLEKTKYEIDGDGKSAEISAVFESLNKGSDNYHIRYDGCSEKLAAFSVQGNKQSWSDLGPILDMSDDQRRASFEIDNAVGDFKDKFQEFIDSLREEADKKGGNAVQTNRDLAKKLREECGADISLTGPVFEDADRGEIRKEFIYTELANKLASIANSKMGSIKVSDPNKAAKNIVDNVVHGYHYISGTAQCEDKKMKLSFDIQSMYNAYEGNIWFTEVGTGKVVTQMILVSMTKDHLEKALQQYAKDLAKLQSDAADAVYSAMAKDLIGKSISDFVGDKFAASFKQYNTKLEEWGVKDFLDFTANCYTVYEKVSAIDLAKIADNADIGGIAEELEKMQKSLNTELKGFTNTVAKKTGKKVVKAAEYLYKICKDYAEDGKITDRYSIPGFFKYAFCCPVEIFVYDDTGKQIGYAGEDDLTYDSSIMIEEAGDAKLIYTPIGKDISFKVNGIGYGEMNCSVEEYDNEGMKVGRLNYYDINLTPESKIEAEIPSDGFVLNNSDLPIKVDGISKMPDACIESKDYSFIDVKVATNDTNGGIFYGSGKYVPGDVVNLIAVPNSGYVFAGWYDSNDNFVDMNRNIEFAARSSEKYTAKFMKLQDIENLSGLVEKSSTQRPTGTSVKRLKALSRGFTIKWAKKTVQVSGYQIQYSTVKKFTKKKTVMKTVKKASTTKLNVNELKPMKKYYVRIRTYKAENGKKHYSAWSKVKHVTTKK